MYERLGGPTKDHAVSFCDTPWAYIPCVGKPRTISSFAFSKKKGLNREIIPHFPSQNRDISCARFELIRRNREYHRINSFCLIFYPLGTKFYALQSKIDPKNRLRKTSGRTNIKQKRTSWKKQVVAAASCEAAASHSTKNLNSEDPCESIGDRSAHLIHDKNTSIAETCIVFNAESAGNDAGWIYWSYDFLSFRHQDFGPRGRHRPYPEVNIGRFKGLNP